MIQFPPARIPERLGAFLATDIAKDQKCQQISRLASLEFLNQLERPGLNLDCSRLADEIQPQ